MGRRRNKPAGGARTMGCVAKRSYPSREAAEKGRRALIGRGQPAWRLVVYGTPGTSSLKPCRWCGGWHVGHRIERKT